MRYSEEGKQGQVTIFVILGIVLIVGVIAFIYLTKGIGLETVTKKDPRKFIRDCVDDSVQNSLLIILANGGEINIDHYVEYFGESYHYLCYTGDFSTSCYNVHPMLETIIEEEIRVNTQDEIQTCFDSLRENLEDDGFDVSYESTEYSIKLLPGIIQIDLDKNIIISKGSSSQSFEDFDFNILSSIYDLVRVSREIINEETAICDFNHYEYMTSNPKYSIERNNYDYNKLYRILDRRTKEEFRFAIRNCVIPQGL